MPLARRRQARAWGLATKSWGRGRFGGDFVRELRVDELGTRAIAKLIIELLARVYDLGTSDNLEYYGPFYRRKWGNPVIVDPERCRVPTSSLQGKLAASTILARHP